MRGWSWWYIASIVARSMLQRRGAAHHAKSSDADADRRERARPSEAESQETPAPTSAAPPRPLGRVGAILGSIGLGILVVVLVQGEPQARGAAFGLAALWGIWLIWKVPQWQAESRRTTGLSEKDLFELENSARTTLGHLVASATLLIGLYFAWEQLGSTNETLELNEEGQITGRFTNAVEQLGNEDVTIRLGGIFALERIARDSEQDAQPVMEVLTAYVRERAPRRSSGTAADPATPAGLPRAPAVDIQAVLDVIARRSAENPSGRCLDLSGTSLTRMELVEGNLARLCLRGADLSYANLRSANLASADLSLVSLVGADLDGANLGAANLQLADLSQANLSGADLQGARLDGARLRLTILEDAVLHDAVLVNADLGNALLFGADFAGAELAGVELTGAALNGVLLGEAHSLTQQQIDCATGFDDRTTLPAGISVPAPGAAEKCATASQLVPPSPEAENRRPPVSPPPHSGMRSRGLRRRRQDLRRGLRHPGRSFPVRSR